MKYESPDGKMYDVVKIVIKDGVAEVRSSPKNVVVIIEDRDSREVDCIYDGALFERRLLK